MITPFYGPRTTHDFDLVSRLVHSGKTDAQIKTLFTNPNWRSELDSKHECNVCKQGVVLDACIECGQPVRPAPKMEEVFYILTKMFIHTSSFAQKKDLQQFMAILSVRLGDVLTSEEINRAITDAGRDAIKERDAANGL